MDDREVGPERRWSDRFATLSESRLWMHFGRPLPALWSPPALKMTPPVLKMTPPGAQNDPPGAQNDPPNAQNDPPRCSK